MLKGYVARVPLRKGGGLRIPPGRPAAWPLGAASRPPGRPPAGQLPTRLLTGYPPNRPVAAHPAAHHPPAPSGRLIKLNYIAQSNVRPPTFVIFTNFPEKVPAAYQRYLVNKIREEFEFEGTPIKIIFRAKSKRRRRS